MEGVADAIGGNDANDTDTSESSDEETDDLRHTPPSLSTHLSLVGADAATATTAALVDFGGHNRAPFRTQWDGKAP